MKNKSSLIVITLLTILCAVSFYIYKNKTSGSTIDKEARDFKIEDTASVTKIFMADKNGNSITLERTKTGWVTPNKYPCRADAINLLLYTMKMVDVKSTVSKNARQGVIKQMIGRSIKVQAFHNDDLIKQYYVGHENMDNDATYMILTDLDNMENYEEPFLMCIPGFNGYLSSRYILNENEWRERVVINYIPPQLKVIKVEFSENPDSSFVIKLNSTTNFELQKLNGAALPFDEVKMKQYLAYFQNISYEKLLTQVNKRLVDSIQNAVPFIKLSITSNQNETKTFNFVRKNSSWEINKKYSVEYKYDPDRFFMSFNTGKETALVQYYVFGKILQTYGYFLPKSTVKK
jgi:hypothetical protein